MQTLWLVNELWTNYPKHKQGEATWRCMISHLQKIAGDETVFRSWEAFLIYSFRLSCNSLATCSHCPCNSIYSISLNIYIHIYFPRVLEEIVTDRASISPSCLKLPWTWEHWIFYLQRWGSVIPQGLGSIYCTNLEAFYHLQSGSWASFLDCIRNQGKPFKGSEAELKTNNSLNIKQTYFTMIHTCVRARELFSHEWPYMFFGCFNSSTDKYIFWSLLYKTCLKQDDTQKIIIPPPGLNN